MSAEATTKAANGRLVHHGAAATSSSKVLAWLRDDDNTLVYASHATINLARPLDVRLNGSEESIPVWNVQETLRTKHSYATSPTEKAPTITALCSFPQINEKDSSTSSPLLACGFSNGSLTLWDQSGGEGKEWQEHGLVDAIQRNKDAAEEEPPRSITDLKGIQWNQQVVLVSCSSAGVTCHSYPEQNTSSFSSHPLTHHTASAVQFESLSDSTVLLLVGTAAPRHNKILIYAVTLNDNKPNFHACGALTGHEDWITCFAWQSATALANTTTMLASGSQDFKIRLWKFTTTTAQGTAISEAADAASQLENNENDDDEGNNAVEEEDLEEHESRMEILWKDSTDQPYQTSVSLEALLLGHEGPVTATQWYPSSSSSAEPILLSSSMDRSILLWSPSEDDGIWTPISRVGSAGGILGGSIGSTLLGYINVLISPSSQWLIGHAYGGALHVWNKTNSQNPLQWKATPCVTGHFDGVTDLCWESTFGDYLLTVSGDQTCRLWAPVPTASAGEGPVWLELARPQVHGYDLSAVTSLSSSQHRHWIVSGADEKELRILDAPFTTVRVLQATQPSGTDKDGNKENVAVERVERAYIPSLGLSNKATAADGAEEDVLDDVNEDNNKPKTVELPYERDLGALSLWLESRKMFGHNTELFCVTSTLEAKSAALQKGGDAGAEEEALLVASTAKARDVDAAAIRIWNPHNGECLQTLSGGHKATVATLSFSPDGGRYLASSGKDRRLCLWKKQGEGEGLYALAAAKDSAHKRIIWSVHFCPFDSSLLASGSRDGNIKIWRLKDGEALEMDTFFSFAPHTLNHVNKPDAATALSFAPLPVPGKEGHALLALGLECGLIELWLIPPTSEGDLAPKLLHLFPHNLCHVATGTDRKSVV